MWGDWSKSKEIKETQQPHVYVTLDEIIDQNFETAIKDNWGRGFPGGSVDKNLPANAGDTGSIPGPGRSHMLRSN